MSSEHTLVAGSWTNTTHPVERHAADTARYRFRSETPHDVEVLALRLEMLGWEREPGADVVLSIHDFVPTEGLLADSAERAIAILRSENLRVSRYKLPFFVGLAFVIAFFFALIPLAGLDTATTFLVAVIVVVSWPFLIMMRLGRLRLGAAGVPAQLTFQSHSDYLEVVVDLDRQNYDHEPEVEDQLARELAQLLP